MYPCDQITQIIEKIYRMGMTTTSGGNISVIDKKGDIWITPSAVDKGTLKPADIVRIGADGNVSGSHKPSSEYPFHQAIYKTRPDLKAVIHAHPPALVSFSIVHEIPNTNITGQIKNICGPVGYASYELPGSSMLGDKIASEFSKGYKAIIMENHGIAVGGKDLMDAYQRFETLEFCAKAILYGKALGEPHYLSDEQINDSGHHIPELLPELPNVEHSSDEQTKRIEICSIVSRACVQGLMISSCGTVSVRWRNNDFLITPRDISRWNIQHEDIVQIKDGMREPGKMPSRSVWLHQEIYRTHPEINSIILTQSPYVMAFSITGSNLDVRTIPESWIFLRDIPKLQYGSHLNKENEITKMLSVNTPAILVENESIIVTGDRLLDTFDRLEVAEFSAKSLVMAKPIGNLKPIKDNQIDDLRRFYLKE